MPWHTRFLWISFLACGCSLLFPPALIITAPIFAVAIVVWVIAAIAGAFRGPAPAPPAVQSAGVDPNPAPPAVDLGGRHPSEMTLDELWRASRPRQGDGDSQ